MFGSYLLLVPVALLLLRAPPGRPCRCATSPVAAGFYILLGAAGASVLASTLPGPHPAVRRRRCRIRAGLLNDFDLARRIAEDGLQGVVQNARVRPGSSEWDSLLRRHRPALGAAAIAVGAFLVVNAVGIMVDVEALRFIGLTGSPPGPRPLSAWAPRCCGHPNPTHGLRAGRPARDSVRPAPLPSCMHADSYRAAFRTSSSIWLEPRRGRGVRVASRRRSRAPPAIHFQSGMRGSGSSPSATPRNVKPTIVGRTAGQQF